MRAVPRCRSLLLVLGLALVGAGLLAPVAGALSFSPPTYVATGPGPESVAVGDFNGDGRQDLATANTWADTVSIQLGNGAGGFSATSIAAGGSPYDLAVGDFNNDSKQDLAVVNNEQYGGLSLLTGDGTGGFTRRQVFATGTDPAPDSVTVGDFNNDGNEDMAAPEYAGGKVHVLLGNGAGGFSPSTEPVDMPVMIKAADFNHDGDEDLAVTCYGSVSILMGLGNGRFRPAVEYRVESDPWALAVDDFNDDGNEDLAMTAMSEKSACVMLSRDDGTFGSESVYPIGIESGGMVAGDFDGDGAVDLLAREYATGQLRVALGDGAGHFALSPTAFTSAYPTGMAVGDFNADGKADFAVCMFGDAKVGVMLGRREIPAGSMSLAGGATTTGTRSVTVGAGVTDATQMRVRNAGAGWSDWTPYLHKAPWTLGAGDGIKTVEAQYRNSIGATEVLTDSILLDTTAPETGSDAPSGWRTGAVTVTLSSSDGTGSGVAETQYKLDDAASWSTGTSVQVSGDGAHTLRYRSVDQAGNVEETQFTTVRVDATPPDVSVSGVDDAWHRLPVLAGFAADDATSGVAGASYSLDGGSWTSGWSTLVSADGDHTLEYKATDNAGNESEAATVHVKIDTKAPNTTDDAPAGWVTSPPVAVTLTPADAGGSGVAVTQYKLDDAAAWSAGDQVVVAGDGAHTLRYRSVDQAGNAEEAQSTSVRLDATAPTASVSGVDDAWHSGPVFALVSAADAGSGVAATAYRLDDSGWTPGPALLVAAEGDHELACKATDVAGNESAPSAAHVRIDLTAPVTAVDAPATWTNQAVTLGFSPADALSGMSGGLARTEYSLDGGVTWREGLAATVEPDAVTHATDALTVLFRSADNAGNVEAEESCRARIDTIRPVSVGNALTARRGKPAKFRVLVQDLVPGSPEARVAIRISTRAGKLVKTLPASTVATNAAATVTWAKCTLKKGAYKYVVLATDAAGNPQSKAGGNRLTVK
jgi:hypothetical protein